MFLLLLAALFLDGCRQQLDPPLPSLPQAEQILVSPHSSRVPAPPPARCPWLGAPVGGGSCTGRPKAGPSIPMESHEY